MARLRWAIVVVGLMFHVKHYPEDRDDVSRETPAVPYCYAAGVDTRADIATGLAALGIDADVHQVELLARHLDMVFEANETLNLTSIDPQDAVALHVLDSATAVPFVAAAPEGKMADLGTGPGFPGIPLTILTGREVALVESVKKKAAYLSRVAETLRLKATVHPIRAEELAIEQRGAFSVVSARALSSLPSLVELASPLLRDHGRLICLKGRADDDELSRGDRAAALCGMKRLETQAVAIPGVEAARVIVVYERTGRSARKLPRRIGLAQREPLA